MNISEIVKQVLFNPQVTHPAISYKVTDVGIVDDEYSSDYIDVRDFNSYLNRLEKQLIDRLVSQQKESREGGIREAMEVIENSKGKLLSLAEGGDTEKNEYIFQRNRGIDQLLKSLKNLLKPNGNGRV